MATNNIPWYYLRRADGIPSLSATLVLVSFGVTTAAYVASAFESIGSVHFRAFDAGAVSAYMMPILANYLGRRWTEAKHAAPVVTDPKPTEQGGD